MKYFLAILVTLICSASYAAQREGQILKCLGEEEKRLHLNKDTGPVYDLNQRLIAEILQIPNVQLSPTDYKLICTGESFFESWKLLELSIVKGKDLFVLPQTLTGIQRSITMSMIDDYVEATREILLNFITQIQTLSPTPDCLKQEIPLLDQFFTEIKYLQEDVDMQQLFKGKDKKIFDKLKGYPSAFQKCRERLKKKPSSESKEAPKKS